MCVFVYTEQVTFKQMFLETDSLEIHLTIKCSVTNVWCLIRAVCRCSLCSSELFTLLGDVQVLYVVSVSVHCETFVLLVCWEQENGITLT